MTFPDRAQGGCMCGRFRYEAIGAPDATLLCHCESCRKHTGAPVVALAGYATDQVKWTSGDPPRYASSANVGRAFCPSCGTPMTWEGDGFAEILIATMDAPERFAPQMHIHHGEHFEWIETADTLPRYRVWHDDGTAPYLNAPAGLTATQQIALVERYFSAVDGEDLEGVLDTLTEDCVFRVETHGVELIGHSEISGMFKRLWDQHQAVRHHDFRYVPDPMAARISAQFQVRNTELDGRNTLKSNCNFFDISDERFSAISVYMAGPNTLDRSHTA